MVYKNKERSYCHCGDGLAPPLAYQAVPVGVDAVSKAGDEESEVGQRDEERDKGDKHDPALQQWHGHIGGGHQDPYQTTEYLQKENGGLEIQHLRC